MEELPHLDRPIKVIGRYALYGKLAAGGMATVHFGRLLGPAGFSRTVAIKRLHPQFAKDPEFVAMFLDEARVAARIQHPNVVATVDVVAMAEELFLVMDYIRGESFSRLLRASRKKGVDVSLSVLASIISGVLHGLHAAHEAKDEQGRPLAVVHRDVSPQNVLVGADGVARVLDFGVAKAAARIQVTRDGQMKGKLAYMAPEQLQGRPVDRRTDVFAAAIVAWEALTGRRLFDAEEPQELLRMIVSEDIPPPSAVVPSIPRAVDAVIMRGLARDVGVRYQTARHFAIALEEVASLASPREVGEWVERVAGDTLQKREQAVAEIEAVSSVSDITHASKLNAGHSKTKVGLAPPPAPAGDWEEGPTRIFESAADVPGQDPATRIHVPRPSSPPGVIQAMRSPAPIPRAAPTPKRRDLERSPTQLTGTPRSVRSNTPSYPAPRPSVPPMPAPRPVGPPKLPGERVSVPPKLPTARASMPPKLPTARASAPPELPTEAAPPSKPVAAPVSPTAFDDNELTLVRSSPSNPPIESSPPVAAKPGWDDESETTLVIDKGGDELLDAAARVTSPPGLGKYPPAPRPAAGTPAAPSVTVVVQDQTSPALSRIKPNAWTLGVVWLWGSPTARARRVGLVAGIAGLLVGVVLYAARGKQEPRVHPPDAAALAEATPRAPRAAQAEPEPRGIDPSQLPVAPEEHHARHEEEAPPSSDAPSTVTSKHVKPTPVTLESESARATPPAEVATQAPPSAPPPQGDTDSPYEKPAPVAPPTPAKAPRAAKVDAPAPRADPPAPKVETSAPKPTAPKATAPKAASACDQPFVVDDQGIRRIKPECL